MVECDVITMARFWSKVDVQKSDRDCWEWRGATASGGHGRIKIKGVNITASRIAWEMINGESLGERYALHHCDNPLCCNPKHIYAGTHQDNANDRAAANLAKRGLGQGRFKNQTVPTEFKLAVVRRIQAGERICDIAAEISTPYTTVASWKYRMTPPTT